MRYFAMIFAVLMPSGAFACDVFLHKDDYAVYTGHHLTIKGQKLDVIAAGTGLPFRIAQITDSPNLRIETVEVFDYNAGPRGGMVGAILINDILYRPNCE